MSGTVLKLIILCSLCVEFGYLQSDCSPTENIPCTQHRYNNDDCSPISLREKFPNIYETNSSGFPGKPGSLDAKARYRQYLNEKWYPEVNLTFTTPQNAGKNSVRGFLVTRTDAYYNPSCYILDLSNVTWNVNSLEEMETIFHLDMFPIPKIDGQPVFAHFELYALPLPATRLEKYDHFLQLFIEFPSQYDPSPTRENWKASIYFSQKSEEGKINVTISPPPPEFGFTQFLYRLEKNTTWEQQAWSVELTHTFTRVPSGTYRITVSPGVGLVTTMTQPFYFNNTSGDEIPPHTIITTVSTKAPMADETTVKAKPSTPDTTVIESSPTRPGDEDVPAAKVIAAVLGSLAGLVLVIGVGLIFLFRHFRMCNGDAIEKPEDDQDFPVPGPNPTFDEDKSIISLPKSELIINNKSADKKRFTVRPKVFVLYEEDHEFHKIVVDKFATYLQQHCQCDVMYVEWQLDSPWVHQELEAAKYVVIVNSEGAYKSYMSKASEKNSPSLTNRRMSSINSIRNKFLHEERYDRYVMVYFDHTDEKFIIPDISPGYKYKLPKHFTDFLLHIHQLKRTDNLAQYDLPLDGNHCSRPIGQDFLESIKKAQQFQLEHPNWAYKKYGLDTVYSHVSDDSKFDSGLPEDFGSPLSTPEVGTYANQQLLQRLLEDGHSVVTVNPSDVGFIECDNPITSISHSSEVFVPRECKSRPKLSPESFCQNPEIKQNSYPPTPPTSGTVESEFAFIPPDDLDEDFDVKSKSQSEQMQSIVDRYLFHSRAARSSSEIAEKGGNSASCIMEENELNSDDHSSSYDRFGDLQLLKIHSGGELSDDVISIGGESV